MKNLRSNSLLKILSTLFVCTALSAAFISCDPVVESGFSSEEEALAALNGTFSYSYGSITIDTENRTYDEGPNSYAGNELTVAFKSDDYTEGYLYFIYTRAFEVLTEEPYYRYSTEAPDVGKYYAVHFKNLTNTSISYAGAYKSGGMTSTDTLEEAETEFTVDNGYFVNHNDLAKNN